MKDDMPDIVERLRSPTGPAFLEMAVREIERLRERVAELQAQLGYMESIETLRAERALTGRDSNPT
jgi:hypothetical protein